MRFHDTTASRKAERHAFRKEFQYDGDTPWRDVSVTSQCVRPASSFASNCRKFGVTRDARGRPDIARGNPITGRAPLTVQVVKGKGGRPIWPEAALRTNFQRLRRPLFPGSRDRATPKLSNVGDFRVDYARLKFSAYVPRRNAAARPRYFPSRDNDLRRETRARFSVLRCHPLTCFSLSVNCAESLRKRYILET